MCRVASLAPEQARAVTLDAADTAALTALGTSACNGQAGHLDDGETISFDVASAMNPGSDNTITLTARGKPGGSAALLVHD